MFTQKKYDYDLIVLGSGSGGSVGAHYAHSLGKKVAIFEGADIGGECPNWACIPTKALLRAAEVKTLISEAYNFGVKVKDPTIDFDLVQDWRKLVVGRTGTDHGEEAFKKDGLHLIKEKAVFTSPHTVEAGGKEYSAAKFLIATGSKVFIPDIEGLKESGYITFKQAVALKEVPESMLIFGAGAVGCEFAQIYARFGCKVTLVNRSSQLLNKEDTEVSDLIKALFDNEGITVLTDTTMTKVEKHGKKKVVHLKTGTKEFFTEVEQLLIATGKIPELNFAPEAAGIELSQGRLKMNKYLQTSVSHIYAAGDIVGPYLFTHTGYYQSNIAAHNAFSSKKVTPDYRVVPRAVFVSPEVASVGMSEKDALERGIRIKKGIAAIAILGRANTSNNFDGFVKVITDKNYTILGASIVASRAGEMIHELALAMQLRAKSTDVAKMIHAYPTYSEAIKIACSLVE